VLSRDIVPTVCSRSFKGGLSVEANSASLADLERRIEFLSAQVERLITLHHAFPPPYVEFRKAVMLAALTFEQEALSQKLLGAVVAHNDGYSVDVRKGLLSFPEETIELFNEYSANGVIEPDQTIDMLKTFVPSGAVAKDLFQAWEVGRSVIRKSNGES